MNEGEEMGCGFGVAGLGEGVGGREGRERKNVLISPSCVCLHLFSWGPRKGTKPHPAWGGPFPHCSRPG